VILLIFLLGLQPHIPCDEFISILFQLLVKLCIYIIPKEFT